MANNHGKTIIIYKSKYNTTKKYAGWLAMKIDSDLYELSDVRKKDLKKYDNIIFGGYIENGYIKGIDFIKDNYNKIEDKNVIVFSVGLNIYKEKEIFQRNFFPTYQFRKIKYFNLLGDFDYKKLDFIDKFKVNYSDTKLNSKLLNKNTEINSNKHNIDIIIDFLKEKNK